MLADVTISVGDVVAALMFCITAGTVIITAYRRHDANTVKRALQQQDIAGQLEKIPGIEEKLAAHIIRVDSYAQDDLRMHEEIRADYAELRQIADQGFASIESRFRAGDERMEKIELDQTTIRRDVRHIDRRLARVEELVTRRSQHRHDDPDSIYLEREGITDPDDDPGDD